MSSQQSTKVPRGNGIEGAAERKRPRPPTVLKNSTLTRFL